MLQCLSVFVYRLGVTPVSCILGVTFLPFGLLGVLPLFFLLPPYLPPFLLFYLYSPPCIYPSFLSLPFLFLISPFSLHALPPSLLQSRLAVNSVILGDYQRPFDISTFVSDLNAGFRLLNLKNDALRKKFDSLKYDVKKIEEVVYDISIRGLRPPHAPQD